MQPSYDYIDENREAILDILRKQGLNLIPVPKGRGKKLGENWDKYANEKCNDEITKDLDFAVIAGVTSDGLSMIDFEIKNISEEERERILLPIMDEIFPNAINETLVVKTGNGYHVYLKTSGHILTSKDFKKNNITIEIKGQNKEGKSRYVIGPSSKHYEKDSDDNYFLSGKVYQIISNTTEIKTLDAEDFINGVLNKGWKPTGQDIQVKNLYSQLKEKGSGSNRQGDMIRILESVKIRNPELPFEVISYIGYWINSEFREPYPPKIADEKILKSWEFANDVLKNRTNVILDNNELFSKMWNDKPEENKEAETAHAIVTICIKSGFMVVKSELKKKLLAWCKKHKVNPYPNLDLSRAINTVIESTFSDSKKFPIIKKICYDLGNLGKPIVFDQDQIAETGEWIKGRYHIKRIELTGDLIYFNDRHYERESSKDFIKNVASSCIVKHTNNSVNEVVGYVERTSPIIKNVEIEKSNHLKCLLNGIYNVKTGEFSDSFSYDHIILNLIPHNFDDNASWEKIEEIVKEIIPDEKEYQTYYDFASTCLHPYTGIDFQLGLVGIPGSGKSTLLRFLNRAFGTENVEHATIHLIAKDLTTQKDIAYKFLNSDEDLSSEDIKQTDVLKKWITQDYFTGRSIYAHASKYRPTSRLMFVANGLYEITNPDDALAMYERTHLIKVKNKFRNTDKEKKAITEKIDDLEYTGFITYLLKNAHTVYVNQKIKYPQNSKTTEIFWNEYGNNIRAFIETYIETGSEYKNQNSEIWSKWLEHSLDKKINPKNKIQFYKKFDEITGNSAIQIRLDKETVYWGYLGLRLKTASEVTEQKTLDKTTKGEILKIIKEFDNDDARLEEIKAFVTKVL